MLNLTRLTNAAINRKNVYLDSPVAGKFRSALNNIHPSFILFLTNTRFNHYLFFPNLYARPIVISLGSPKLYE